MDKKQLENLAREYAKIVASNMVVNRIILYLVVFTIKSPLKKCSKTQKSRLKKCIE